MTWSVTTSPPGIKTRSSEAIEQEQDARREEDAERQQTKNRRDEPSPTSKRKPSKRHALRAKIDQRGDEIESAHQRCAAEDRQTDNPQSLAPALPRADNFAERA